MLKGFFAVMKYFNGAPWMGDRRSNMVCSPTDKNTYRYGFKIVDYRILEIKTVVNRE